MKLWTLQGKGFAIESTPVDYAKSNYYNDDADNYPNIQKAYQRLFSDMKTDKFLWCFPTRKHSHEPEIVLYELEVPEEEILAYICECVWHKIITDCRKFPNRDCEIRWQRQHLGREYEDQQTKQCYSKESEDQLWGRLFWPLPTKTACPAGIKLKPEQKNEMCSALIKSPIEKGWIISKRNVNQSPHE